ncbi:P-loop containing nucleoside triphosphate hydrolase protein [Kockiozyma suomiensis]|uniref:P-loop containing nucleoside triphosphate hydrolase protein n=1 Tax=Kockiozyma suomiensis TaxID=1337062 RepID=UPI0033443018
MPPKVVVLVAGGQAAGKKSVCKAITERLVEWKVTDVRTISLSQFKIADLTDKGLNPEGPDAFDFSQALTAVLAQHNEVLIVEGLYALYEATSEAKALRDIGNIRIYVDLDADVRLSRRINRDTQDRGIPLKDVLDDYVKFGKPAMESYIRTTKPTADVVLMRGSEPSGIELIAGAIYDHLLAISENIYTPAWAGGHTGRLLDDDMMDSFYELA